MKSCVEMPFGISVDEDLIFKVSVVILCLFSLLLGMVVFFIIWLRNIRRRLDSTSKKICSLPLVISNKRNSWKHFTGADAYGPLEVDRDDLRLAGLPEASMAQEQDGTSVQAYNVKEKTDYSDKKDALCLHNTYEGSSRDHPGHCAKDGKLKKMYMSLKTATGNIYASPRVDSSQEDFAQGQCSADGERAAKCQEGNDSQERQKDNTDEYDHGYLVVIHSDKSAGSPEGDGNEMPPHEDESLYLIPIEENANHNKEKGPGTLVEGRGKVNDASANDGSVSEEDKHGYLSSQQAGTLTTFGHYKQTHCGETLNRSGISKRADEDGFGYLFIQHVEDAALIDDKAGSIIAAELSQARGIPESSGLVDESYRDEENYDYATNREVKFWPRSPNNDVSKLQKGDDLGPDSSTENYLNVVREREEKNSHVYKAELETEPSNEDNHEYLIAVDGKEENNSNYKSVRGAQSSNEDCSQDYLPVIHTSDHFNTTEQIYDDINDNNNNNNNNNNTDGTRSVANYFNREIIPNVGTGANYSDDVPVYANNDVQGGSSVCYENLADVQRGSSVYYDNPTNVRRGSSVCHDNPTFYDESPIYDNDVVDV